MANVDTNTTLGTTVYYKGQQTTFHGIVTGTDCVAVEDLVNPALHKIVLGLITDVSTTPPSP